MGLVADSAVEGNLGGTYDHRDQVVTLTYPDGATATLIDAETGQTHAELVLDAGQYRVDISARYDERGEQDAMAAYVTVDWVDASVPVQTTSWSEVKALFR